MTIVYIILIFIALVVFTFLMTTIFGVAIGIALFRSGHYILALLSMALGIGTNIVFWSDDSCGYYEGHDGCPFCGSSDYDGNHCYSCDEDS